MKGMLDFLERAGLVTRDNPLAQTVPEVSLAPPADAAALEPMTLTPITPPASLPPLADVASAADANAGASAAAAAPSAVSLDLDSLYASAGVPAAQYPAERLLRLIDGLSAMDEATRLMAIKAMDAADESWTIADPLRDAAAKVAALAAHGETLRLELKQFEAQTQTRLDSVLARQDTVVGDIRKQISELEALAARELARAEQETAAQQMSLQAARNQTAAELAAIAQTSTRLQSLSSQFGTSPQPLQE
jgi:hypothetical protein